MKRILFFMTAIVLFACHNKDENSKTIRDTGTADVVAENIDTTVKPGDDFFLFANGAWIKKTAIPESESSWGIGNLVNDELIERLRKINEAAVATKNENGSASQKIADFWLSAMDTIAIEKAGLSPLQADFSLIDSIKNTNDLITAAALLKRKGVACLFNDYVTQDDKISDKIAYRLDQGGLGMPNRDYYLNKDERSMKVKNAYMEYVTATFLRLLKDADKAKKAATDVLVLETKLANASRKLADLRDPYKNYNKLSLQALQQKIPEINWDHYGKITGFNGKIDSVIIGQPEFFSQLNYELKHSSLNSWKHYFKMHMILSFTRYLDSTAINQSMAYRKSLTGATTLKARWKRVIDMEEKAIGDLLGQLFVKAYFSEKAKKRYSDMVENVREAFKNRIEKLTWMSDSTKLKAKAKLSGITKKVGYPTKWKDFSALTIDRGPLVLNIQRSNEWLHNYAINKLGKPVNRDEWEMTPQTYNAYYNPSNNEIVLPAGIFTIPGYRDEEIDDAVAYGYAAASTIGHEITHGFDDQGRQYDANGNLTNWWTKSDEDEFKKRAQKIITQFNEFMPVDNLHINGEATQGENIADLGGILIGLDAFKKTEAYTKNLKIAGYTPLQRFFLGYALAWMYQSRKESLANQVTTDYHAPEKERVNGPVVNVAEFYEAFGIKPGNKMFRADSLRVNIW